MKKFAQNQALQALEVNDELSQCLPHNYRSTIISDEPYDSLSLMHYMKSPLVSISSFAFVCSNEIKLIRPFCDAIMSFDVAEQLRTMYSLLYPNQSFGVMSRFFRKFGRITIAGNLIGSELSGPNNKSYSVIMAYWPGRSATLENIDYSRMRVGVVQYFIRHELTFKNVNQDVKEEHVFAYVYWKETHSHYDWYGLSATVCANSYEGVSACCFLPVQRIGQRCDFIVMPIEFGDFSESVFIACPIQLHYSL